MTIKYWIPVFTGMTNSVGNIFAVTGIT